MNYDKILSNFFLLDNWHFNKEHCKLYTKKKKKLINVKKYIDTRYIDSKSFKETIYRMYYNIENRPVCKSCGNEVEFLGKSNILFRKYCCNSCSAKSLETIHKKQLTDKEKHNGKLGWNKNTKEKIEKRLNTIYNKYGSMSYFQNKVKQTCLNKYGYISPLQVPDILLKRNNTLKLNNHNKFSKQEDIVYNILLEKFDKDNIIRQYSSKDYPFNCDFYIKSLDLYIECHFSHFHHYHPFDKNNINDINELNKLNDKSKIIKNKYNKSTSQYDKIIYTWTDLDVRKLNTFILNNLNYKIFYNLNDVNLWIKKEEE